MSGGWRGDGRPPAAAVLPRAAILADAAALICGPRQADYGPPAESFGRIAAMWSAFLGRRVTPAQVAGCMALVKLARLAHDPAHRDSAVDAAGYVALLAELAAARAAGHAILAGLGDGRDPAP